MSHHSSDYESASADLVEYFGQPILYYDPSLVAAITIDAMVRPERTERQKTESGWNAVQVRDVFFDADAVTARMDGTVTFGGSDYSIQDIGTAEGNRTMLKIKRSSAGQISRPRSRG